MKRIEIEVEVYYLSEYDENVVQARSKLKSISCSS
jgi:hypothetical protein